MSVDDDDAVLFSAATLFDGFIDGVMNFEAGGTVVEIECNTESGHEFAAQSGQSVWPAAEMMCRYFADLPSLVFLGDGVLELGAGVGLPSVYLSKRMRGEGLCPKALITDASIALCDIVKRNISRNDLQHVTVKPVIWGEPGVRELDVALDAAGMSVSTIIATDTFHSGGSTTALPFLHTVAHVFARWPAAVCIVCSSFRSDDTTELVLKCCATLGMKREVLYDKLSLGEEAVIGKEGQDACLIERFSALS